MLRVVQASALLQRPLQYGVLSTAIRGLAGSADQQHLTKRLKEAVHKAEDAVLEPLHKLQHAVHDRLEHAREEAERGAFTADFIEEAAAQMAEAEHKHQGGLADKLKHKAEDVVHKAEDVVHRAEEVVLKPVHKLQDAVHERREHAQEEAERGMYTADDIREAAAQMAATKGGDQSIVETAAETKRRMSGHGKEVHPDSEEELLEEATQDWGTAGRQREIKGLQEAVKEES